MAYRPYSVRFVAQRGYQGVTYYTVPSGFRASVKMIAASNPARIAGTAGVLVAEQYVYIRDFQVSNAFESLATMCVAYAGDRIGVYTGHPELAVMVSGFLYTEAAQLATLPAPPELEQSPEAPPPLKPPPL